MCKLVEKYGRFRGTCHLHRQRSWDSTLERFLNIRNAPNFIAPNVSWSLLRFTSFFRSVCGYIIISSLTSPEIVVRIKKNYVHCRMYLPYVIVSSWGRSGSNLTNDNAAFP